MDIKCAEVLNNSISVGRDQISGIWKKLCVIFISVMHIRDVLNTY